MRTDLSAPGIEQADDLAVNASRFLRHRRASGLSPKTEKTYLAGLDNLAPSLASRHAHGTRGDQPRTPQGVADCHARGGPQADDACRPLRSVQQFFRWALEERLIARSPMASMRPPKVPEAPPSVLRDEALEALLKKVEADESFAGRRDTAALGWQKSPACAGRLTTVDERRR